MLYNVSICRWKLLPTSAATWQFQIFVLKLTKSYSGTCLQQYLLLFRNDDKNENDSLEIYFASFYLSAFCIEIFYCLKRFFANTEVYISFVFIRIFTN